MPCHADPYGPYRMQSVMLKGHFYAITSKVAYKGV